MRKSKILSLITLSITALLLSGFTWAFWASGVSVDGSVTDSNTVTLGTASSANTSIVVAKETGAEVLVPKGRGVSGTSVDEITHTFDVTWKEEHENSATGTKGTLNIENLNNSFLKDGENPIPDTMGLALVSIENPNPIITIGDTVTVSVKVQLKEPETKEDYLKIAGKKLESQFEFKIDVISE